jgi:hypothetical protein
MFREAPGGPGVPGVFPGCSQGGSRGVPGAAKKLAILSKFRHFICQVVARGFDLPGTPESPGNPRGIPVQAPPLPPVSGYGVCGRDPPCGAGGARWGPGRGKWGAVGSGPGFPVERVGGIPGESYGALLGNPGGIPGSPGESYEESYGALRGIPGKSYGILWGNPGVVLWNTMGNPGESRGNIYFLSRIHRSCTGGKPGESRVLHGIRGASPVSFPGEARSNR